MIDPAYACHMARYNRWQNENLYGVAAGLSDEERRRERGAFFGSIHKTLSHLLWADQIWMSRLAGTPKPEGGISQSVALYPDWEPLKRERAAVDRAMLDWAEGLEPEWLAEDHTWYSGAIKAEVSKPRWLLVAHLFNHQTHHRGQVHCLLTQAGGKPDDTDLFILPS